MLRDQFRKYHIFLIVIKTVLLLPCFYHLETFKTSYMSFRNTRLKQGSGLSLSFVHAWTVSCRFFLSSMSHISAIPHPSLNNNFLKFIFKILYFITIFILSQIFFPFFFLQLKKNYFKILRVMKLLQINWFFLPYPLIHDMSMTTKM